MDNAHLEKLRLIKTFPSLVKYLREDLDWPIASDDFEELTFDYQPEELGLEPKIAVKIREIKQLRPLVTNQPWGIFFINFEPKRLPVLVLRRVLRSLVFKERTSANKPKQAAWHLHDLLFISSYGEENERAITFAHFKDEPEIKLPSLKVIGWDTQDTPLHMDQCAEELGKLRFDTALTTKQWQMQWSSAFTLEHREVITTSKELAERMASLATKIRKRVNAILKLESETGPIRKLYKAFQQTLIHDLNEDDFADMYAQTVTYGLFSARCSRAVGIDAGDLSEMIPSSNPFLKDLLSTFVTIGGRKGKIDFDELGINDVVSLLNNANMEAVKRDFGDKNPEHDPVIHFYEDFLKQYDAQKKVKRGVFYTPKPVVSFIVRSVHEILQKEFGLEDGLADITTWGEIAKRNKDIKIPEGVSENEPFVQILDPAVGTGTFLVEVIDVVKKTMYKKWEKQGHLPLEFVKLWNEYVPKHLLSRLYGFELMMAPYAIAHMKIGLKLFETEYKFGADERAHIYLTNSLEPPQDFSDIFEQMAPALAHEANAVNTVKRNKRFTVVIGNPPYSGHSANASKDSDGNLTFIGKFIEAYKYIDGQPLGEKQSKWLQDDYVKFISLSAHYISECGVGIIGLITNHSYLDNPTFRGMRQQLMTQFANLWICDLHGNSTKKETPPSGKIDENVFDIQQGVAILLMCKDIRQLTTSVVKHSEIWDTREYKYAKLYSATVSKTNWAKLAPCPTFYLYIPQNVDLRSEYERAWSITRIMPTYNVGFVTARDQFVVDFDFHTLQKRMELFRKPESELSNKEIRSLFGIKDTTSWNVKKARDDFRKNTEWKKTLITCLYRAFDFRPICYSLDLLERPVFQIQKHLLAGDNLGLLVSRQIVGECRHAFVTNVIANFNALATAGRLGSGPVFPLFIVDISELHQDKGGGISKTPNFSREFLIRLTEGFGLANTKSTGLPLRISSEDIFYYLYAILNSPNYRKRYSEFLKGDFPRLPLTGNLELFRALALLGEELVALHIMESAKLTEYITKWVGPAPSSEIEKVIWSDDTVWINKSKTEGFKGITENVWNFHIGGYQVCEKWLKDRKDRKLSKEDIEHYHKIVVALNETIRLMKEIDEIIDAHGGWPKAFSA